jgi:hypothetical protein
MKLAERLSIQPNGNETELVSQRTENFKIFQSAGQRHISGSVAKIHYKDDPFSTTEQLKEIDLDLVATPQVEIAHDYEMTQNGHQLFLTGSTLKFQRAGEWVEMSPTAIYFENATEKHFISNFIDSMPIIDNDKNQIIWVGAFGKGIDFAYNISPDKLFKTVIIHSLENLPKPTISEKGLKLTIEMSWKTSVSSNFTTQKSTITSNTAFKDTQARDLWFFQVPRAWDSTGEYDINEEFKITDKSLFISVPYEFFITSIFPIYLDTAITQERVPNSLNDAHMRGSTWPGQGGANPLYSDALGTVNIGWGTIVNTSTRFVRCMGIIFDNIPIAKLTGIHVISAAVQLNVATNNATPTTRCYGAAVDSCADWADTTNITTGNPGVRTRTTAYDSLATTATGWNSWDAMAAAVEEILGRANWALNNEMGFIFANNHTTDPSTDEGIEAYTYDNGSAYAAKLDITYSYLATVTTQNCTDVAITTATGNGNITAIGGENSTRRGVCYMVGTSGDPTTANSVFYADGSFGTGAYTQAMTGLTGGTGYRVRAYTVNSAGTSYGATVQLTTSPATSVATVEGLAIASVASGEGLASPGTWEGLA